jgi:hypothetical protein
VKPEEGTERKNVSDSSGEDGHLTDSQNVLL